jgi:hypothetical protein
MCHRVHLPAVLGPDREYRELVQRFIAYYKDSMNPALSLDIFATTPRKPHIVSFHAAGRDKNPAEISSGS